MVDGNCILLLAPTLIPLVFGIIEGIQYLQADEEYFQRKYVEQEPIGSLTDGEGREVLRTAHGFSGDVQLYDDRVVITRRSVLSKIALGGGEEGELLRDKITDVAFQGPADGEQGKITFTQTDGKTYSVSFGRSDFGDFKAVRDALRSQESGTENSESNIVSETAMETLQQQFVNREISEDEFHRKRDILKS